MYRTRVETGLIECLNAHALTLSRPDCDWFLMPHLLLPMSHLGGEGGCVLNDDDMEIVQEFLVESHENLDQLDRDLVELEQAPGSRDLLSSIFRTIHTIKGTSGFLAFGRLEAVTHVGENLLSRLRDGELTMTPAIATSLLRMVDCVRALLEVIERTGEDVDPSVDVDPVVAEIRGCLEGRTADAAEATTSAPEPAAVEEVVAPAADAESHDAVIELAAELTPPPLGAILVEAGRVEPEAVAEAMHAQAEGDTRKLGEILVEQNAVAQTDVDEALHAQARRGVTESTVRVDVDLLDTLVRLVGELVLTRNQILQQADSAADVDLVRASQRLNLVASELQESVMKTRMQPIGNVWAKLPRVVRDLGTQLGRKVRLEMEGHETELDRTLLEAVKDPLTHLVRNAIDHGIEPTADRLAAGKPEEGTLSLRAFHESGQVVVEISDDGKGIDPAKIGAAAIAKGLITQDMLARMDNREVLDLIFRAGFSTAAAVTNVSGRGVGMDVVRTNIERIGGTVDLSSKPGRGTTVRVRIPLTLAIIPALVVGEGGERYAIPQANLVELVRLEGNDLRNLETLAGAPVLRLRGRLLPVVSMANALGLPESQVDALTIVVVQADDIRFGLAVSDVHDTQEIVVKPLGRQMKGLALYAGATIMGDGRVSLILDVAGLAHDAGVESNTTGDGAEARTTDEDRTSLLVLDIGDDRRAAMPLAMVSRLEEFEFDKVERSGGTEVVQYRDGILPLVRLAKAIGIRLDGDGRGARDTMSVVVHDDGEHRVGIVVERVLDVVETNVVTSNVGKRAGVLGSAVVQDKVTDLVDLDAVVAMAVGAA
jgi:two-component system chemotaxis sensor kinase CheA